MDAENAKLAALLFRDIGSTVVGLGGIVAQFVTGDFNAIAMSTCVTLVATPLLNLRALRPNGGESSTPDSGSDSPPSPPSQPSSSPSSSV